jgi:hypothetical protein
MTLEFKELVPQIARMGAMLEKLDFDLSARLQQAYARYSASSDLAAVWERIDWVRQSDVSGYRGAAPVDLPQAEPINARFAAPAPPPTGTIVAADGSQIYPNEQHPVHYYLLNLGAFVYHYGIERTPEQYTNPRLYYHKDHVHDKYGRVIGNRAIDDQRTIAEIEFLAQYAWQYRDEARPLIALYDNRLMFQPGGDPGEIQAALKRFWGALVHLHDSGAILAGYIDNPFRSQRFIQLLYLMSLESEDEVKQKQHQLAQAGDLDGLRDRQFFDFVLEPGERSAIMVQNSPLNLQFRNKGESLEIAFFYIKVGSGYQSRVVRVDLPMWVARDARAVDELHALLLAQCAMQGRNPYPYALTRADELAVVSSKDRFKLDELIKAQIRLTTDIAVDTANFGGKDWGKVLARSEKRRFEIRNKPTTGTNP